MSHTATGRFSPYPTIPSPVIEAAQQAHLISESWTKLIDGIPQNVWQMSRTPPFNGLLDTAHKIALHHTETVSALQEIPHRVINQTLAAQSAAMADLVQSVRTAISMSGIDAALAATDTLRIIPIARMQHLLSIWQPPYIPPSFLDIAVSTTPPDFAKRTPRHPRKRQIRKAARKDFLCLTRDALTYLERSAPEVLDSTKKFFQSTQFDCFLFILNGGKDCLTSGLSPEDKEAFNLIWFISTLLITFFKYAR